MNLICSTKIHSNPALGLRCSCSECDSIGCFAKRNIKNTCPCYDCDNPTTCFFYKNNNDVENKKSVTKIEKENNRIRNAGSKVFKKEIKLKYDKEMNTDDRHTERRILINKITKDLNDVDKHVMKHQRSLSFTYSRRGNKPKNNPNTAKLTAEVMDVPVADVEKEINKPSEMSSIAKLSKYDILKTLKEAYAACTCKICECVTSSFAPSTCKCKPCDCRDCAKLVSDKPSGCPCIRCDRSQCKGIANRSRERNICDCDSIECADSVPKECACRPCQCQVCEMFNSKGPANEDCSGCKCSPCDCISCKFVRLSISTHDASTNTESSRFCDCETCLMDSYRTDEDQECECPPPRNIITKPFKEDIHEFDIRNIMISDHRSPLFERNFKSNNFYEFPKPKTEISKHRCVCDDCECITCACKENIANGIKASKLFHCPEKRISFERFGIMEDLSNSSHVEFRNSCTCGICECLNCERANNETYDSGRKTKSQFHNMFGHRQYSIDNFNASESVICPLHKDHWTPLKFDRRSKDNNYSQNNLMTNKGARGISVAFTDDFDSTVFSDYSQKKLINITENHNYKNVFENNGNFHQKDDFFTESKYSANNCNRNRKVSNTEPDHDILTIKNSIYYDASSFPVFDNERRISAENIPNNSNSNYYNSVRKYIRDILADVLHFSLNTINFQDENKKYKQVKIGNSCKGQSKTMNKGSKLIKVNSRTGGNFKFNSNKNIADQSINNCEINDSFFKLNVEIDRPKARTDKLEVNTKIAFKGRNSCKELSATSLKLNDGIKHSPTTITRNSDGINEDKDYERVKRTLQKAKDFSMKLMKVLEHYEKVNKEHKDISMNKSL